MFQDELPKKPDLVITPGEDLSELGLEQLAERKQTLLDEIARIDEITAQKQAGLVNAESFFRKT